MKTFSLRLWALADVLALWLALLIATYIAGREMEGVRFLYVLEWRLSIANVLALTLLSIVWVVINHLLDSYRDPSPRIPQQLLRVGTAVAIGVCLLSLGSVLLHIRLFSPKFIAVFALSYFPLDLGLRHLQTSVWSYLDPARHYQQQVVLLGTDPACDRFLSAVRTQPHCLVAGYFAPQAHPAWPERHLGSLDRLNDYLSTHVVDAIFVGLSMQELDVTVREALTQAEAMGIEVLLPLRTLEEAIPLPQPLGHRAYLRRVISGNEPEAILAFDSGPQMGWSYFIKRLLDITTAMGLLLLLSPLLLAIAIAIRTTMGSPVFPHGLPSTRFFALQVPLHDQRRRFDA